MPHPNMMAPHAARPTPGDPRYYDREPSQDNITQGSTGGQVPYFPEGGVAAPPFMIVNPLSHGDESFPGNGTPNQLLGPAVAEWIQIRDSKEQGVGVPQFKRWPRQFHSEAFYFGSLDVMPFPDQLGPPPIPTQRTVKQGWSVPKNSEQYEQSVGQQALGDLMQTNDPASQAFAIGWGYVG